MSEQTFDANRIYFHVGLLDEEPNHWKSEGFHRMIENMNYGDFDEGDFGYGILGTGVYCTEQADDLHLCDMKDENEKEGKLGYAVNIDPDKYNLLKADTDKEAERLLFFLSKYQGYTIVNGIKDFHQWDETMDEITPDALYKLYEKTFRDNAMPREEFDITLKQHIELVANAASAGVDEKSRFIDLPEEFDHADNIATLLVKQNGFDGVDLRGTSYGGYEHGTVIYDLHPEDIIAVFDARPKMMKYYQELQSQTKINDLLAQLKDSIVSADKQLEQKGNTKPKQRNITFNDEKTR